MKLSKLVDGIGEWGRGPSDPEINKICYDSRQVAKGDMYVALIGAKLDGHDFIASACERGAAAVVHSRDCEMPAGVVGVKVPDSRDALSKLATRFYHDPSSRITVIGVTGTKGKTTTTYLIEHILNECGIKCGLMGTIQYRTGARTMTAGNTTPESLDIASYMSEMVEAGCRAAVMEVSSHALVQGRVSDICFDVGVFTNLGHDHLDYHLTFEGYAIAKAKLFSSLSQNRGGANKLPVKAAVLNADDQYSGFMGRHAREAGARSITYGLQKGSFLYADDIRKGLGGNTFTVRTIEGESVEVTTKLMGSFNIYSCLAAMGACLAAGIGLDRSAVALASFEGVPGRFQSVDAGQDFAVVVDYAHTPDSLENVLRTARDITSGRLISVFGCGGDRDRTKRPKMGAVSQQLADYTLLTSDNPRSEDPMAIIREISEGMIPGKAYEVEPDRRAAIKKAVRLARQGDLVVIAGKGHETYQIKGQTTVHFDDREEAASAITELLGK